MRNIFAILVLLVLLAGGIVLQIFLSKMKSRWFGLILPSITFIYSLLMIFSVAAYQGMTGGGVFMMVASILLLCNIPTIVLLGIYFGCREKMKVRAQLEKMNIQDLQ